MFHSFKYIYYLFLYNEINTHIISSWSTCCENVFKKMSKVAHLITLFTSGIKTDNDNDNDNKQTTPFLKMQLWCVIPGRGT